MIKENSVFQKLITYGVCSKCGERIEAIDDDDWNGFNPNTHIGFASDAEDMVNLLEETHDDCEGTNDDEADDE